MPTQSYIEVNVDNNEIQEHSLPLGQFEPAGFALALPQNSTPGPAHLWIEGGLHLMGATYLIGDKEVMAWFETNSTIYFGFYRRMSLLLSRPDAVCPKLQCYLNFQESRIIARIMGIDLFTKKADIQARDILQDANDLGIPRARIIKYLKKKLDEFFNRCTTLGR